MEVKKSPRLLRTLLMLVSATLSLSAFAKKLWFQPQIPAAEELKHKPLQLGYNSKNTGEVRVLELFKKNPIEQKVSVVLLPDVIPESLTDNFEEGEHKVCPKKYPLFYSARMSPPVLLYMSKFIARE